MRLVGLALRILLLESAYVSKTSTAMCNFCATGLKCRISNHHLVDVVFRKKFHVWVSYKMILIEIIYIRNLRNLWTTTTMITNFWQLPLLFLPFPVLLFSNKNQKSLPNGRKGKSYFQKQIVNRLMFKHVLQDGENFPCVFG